MESDINRNIVECKDACEAVERGNGKSINRNIVECKVQYRRFL